MLTSTTASWVQRRTSTATAKPRWRLGRRSQPIPSLSAGPLQDLRGNKQPSPDRESLSPRAELVSCGQVFVERLPALQVVGALGAPLPADPAGRVRGALPNGPRRPPRGPPPAVGPRGDASDATAEGRQRERVQRRRLRRAHGCRLAGAARRSAAAPAAPGALQVHDGAPPGRGIPRSRVPDRRLLGLPRGRVRAQPGPPAAAALRVRRRPPALPDAPAPGAVAHGPPAVGVRRPVWPAGRVPARLVPVRGQQELARGVIGGSPEVSGRCSLTEKCSRVYQTFSGERRLEIGRGRCLGAPPFPKSDKRPHFIDNSSKRNYQRGDSHPTAPIDEETSIVFNSTLVNTVV